MNLSITTVLIISLTILALFSVITILVGYIYKLKSNNYNFLMKNKKMKHIKDVVLKEDTGRLLVEVQANQLLANFLLQFGNIIGDKLTKQNQQTINDSEKNVKKFIESNNLETEKNRNEYVKNQEIITKIREALQTLSSHIKDSIEKDKKNQDTFNNISLELNKYYQFIENKNQEVEKYKNGYEFSINKRAILNILSVIEAIQLNKTFEKNTTHNLISLLETNVLRQMNVFRIEIKVGDKVNPQTMFVSGDSRLAKEQSEFELVYDILSYGYQVIEGNTSKVIKEAKVLAYRRG